MPSEKPKVNKSAPFNSEALRLLIDKLRLEGFSALAADWHWILSFARPFRWQLLLYTLLGIFSSLTALCAGVAGKYLIDFITGRNMNGLLTVILLLAVGSALSLLFSALSRRLAAQLSVKVTNAMRSRLFGRLLNARWSSAGDLANGDILNRFTADLSSVAGNAVSWVPGLVIGMITFISVFGVLCYYDWKMAVISMLSAPVLLLTGRPFIRRLRERNEALKRADSALTAHEVETIYHLDNIKSFNVEKAAAEKLEDRQQTYTKTVLDHNLLGIYANTLLSVVAKLVELAVFAYCLYRLWHNEITFGTMTLFLQQRATLASAFSGLVGLFPGFITGAVSAHRMRVIDDLPQEPDDEALKPEPGLRYGISCEDAVFIYEDGTERVIDRATLDILPGEFAAIIGPSGKGKTTFLRILLGLIQPESGQLSITGSGSDLPVAANTRPFFAYVPQGNSMLAGTIRENLLLVNPAADEAQMRRALETACAWEFVSEFPEGLDTRVGELGHGLSEGQAQRLAIARALLCDAPILIMDEATGALDPETERRLIANLRGLTPEKTCILTTHRTGILAGMDRVFRIRDGAFEVLSPDECEQL